MSDIDTRTQAKNIVEYVWRKRNHNDDIPRQYLTDMLVDCIAQALALAREEGRAEALDKQHNELVRAESKIGACCHPEEHRRLALSELSCTLCGAVLIGLREWLGTHKERQMQSNLEILRKLEAEATPGPWHIGEDDVNPTMSTGPRFPDGSFNYVDDGFDCGIDGRAEANTSLKVAARNALPLMLAVVESAEKSLELIKHVQAETQKDDRKLDEACNLLRMELAAFNAAKIGGSQWLRRSRKK